MIKKAIIYGLLASGGIIAALISITSMFLAIFVSLWWLIGFALCGLLAGVLVSVSVEMAYAE